MPRRNHYDNVPWCLGPVKPGMVKSFSRWNLVAIAILAFFVVGAFVMTMTPVPGHAAGSAHKVPLKIDKDPAPVSLAALKNGCAGVIDPALPAVVNISSSKVVKQQNQVPGFFDANGEASGTALQGVQVQDLAPAVAQELGIAKTTRGVVITSVHPASAAAVADLERGDVIREVNRKPVRNVKEYREALAQAHAQAILLLVSRGDTTRFMVVQPQ